MRIVNIRLFMIICLSYVIAGSGWAAEGPVSPKQTLWNDLFTDIVGQYPPRNTDTGTHMAGYKGRLEMPKNWSFDMGLKRYIISHTSYEFGAPGEPTRQPLSRLEYPLDTWWLSFDLRRTCPR